MNATRLLTSPARLATCAVLVSATVLSVPLHESAHAAGSWATVIPAPDGGAAVNARGLDIDDLVAQRKAAWAADRVARHLFTAFAPSLRNLP
jgi:hypothetical protein